MRPLTTEQQERHWAKGHGQGEGRNYKPWIRTTDFPSSDGVRTDFRGLITKRMHATLSGLERGAILLAQRLPNIVDIREQYPLPLEATDAIAERLGVKPPSKQGHPQRVTTDILLTFKSEGVPSYKAIAVKPWTDLADPRKLELLSLEMVYWQARGTPWHIITDREMTRPLLDRLNWFDQHSELVDTRFTSKLVNRTEILLLDRIRSGTNAPLTEVCLEVDDALGHSSGSTLTIFRHFVATLRWSVPIKAEIGPGLPIGFDVHVPSLDRVSATR